MRTVIVCSLAALMATPSSAASLGSSAVPEVVKGVQSCLTATREDGVDIDSLQNDGWSKVTVSDGGRTVASPIPMLSKGSLILVHQASGPTPICTIMAKVPDVPAISGVATALDGALETGRKIENGKAIPAYWFPEGHVVQLASTGSEKAPGVRIVVAYRE